MLIKMIPTQDGGWQITAASYSTREIGYLLDVLDKAGEFRIRNPTRRDRAGRQIEEVHFSKETAIRLGRLLGGTFARNGKFVSDRTKRAGQNYACTEITSRGRGAACENITATDNATAVVKCALIAGRNAWFGGEASVGSCK
jgi:hypothetical protein